MVPLVIDRVMDPKYLEEVPVLSEVGETEKNTLPNDPTFFVISDLKHVTENPVPDLVIVTPS